MITHTPGPWSAGSLERPWTVSKTVCDFKPYPIARMFQPGPDGHDLDGMPEHKARCLADMRLLAAAPDLLAALRAVLDELSDGQGISQYSGAVARAAVDRAEGR